MSDTSVHAARFDRLTPRELRVLVLSIDGNQTTADIAAVLGTTRGTVQSIRQTVRRKLAVPPHVDLRWFVESVPGLSELVATERTADAASTPRTDRRSRAVLRTAIRELEDLTDRTAARASTLASLGSDDDGSLGDEVRLLRTIADSLSSVTATVLERARMA